MGSSKYVSDNAWSAKERWQPFYEQYHEDRKAGNYTKSALIAVNLFEPKIKAIISSHNENIKEGGRNGMVEYDDMMQNAYIFFLTKIVPTFNETINDNFVAHASPRLRSLINIVIDSKGDIHFTDNDKEAPIVTSIDDGYEQYEEKESNIIDNLSDMEAEKQQDFFKTCLSVFNQKYGHKHGTFTYCQFYFTKAYRWGWDILETYDKVFRYFEILGAKPCNDKYDDKFLIGKRDLCIDRLCRNLGLNKKELLAYEKKGRLLYPKYKGSFVLLYIVNADIDKFNFKIVKDLYNIAM